MYVNLTYTLDGAIRNKSDHVIYLKQTATARIFFWLKIIDERSFNRDTFNSFNYYLLAYMLADQKKEYLTKLYYCEISKFDHNANATSALLCMFWRYTSFV